MNKLTNISVIVNYTDGSIVKEETTIPRFFSNTRRNLINLCINADENSKLVNNILIGSEEPIGWLNLSRNDILQIVDEDYNEENTYICEECGKPTDCWNVCRECALGEPK